MMNKKKSIYPIMTRKWCENQGVPRNDAAKKIESALYVKYYFRRSIFMLSFI